jgi:signal transduction histidine kinase
MPGIQVGGEVRQNVFLTLKEAIANILKHSGATQVVFDAKFDREMWRFILRDNGNGFDPEETSTLGHGLSHMKQRMERIGGRMILHSHPGQGAEIILELKLRQILPA